MLSSTPNHWVQMPQTFKSHKKFPREGRGGGITPHRPNDDMMPLVGELIISCIHLREKKKREVIQEGISVSCTVQYCTRTLGRVSFTGIGRLFGIIFGKDGPSHPQWQPPQQNDPMGIFPDNLQLAMLAPGGAICSWECNSGSIDWAQMR